MKGAGSSQGQSKPTILRNPPQTRPANAPLKSIGNSGGNKQRG